MYLSADSVQIVGGAATKAEWFGYFSLLREHSAATVQ